MKRSRYVSVQIAVLGLMTALMAVLLVYLWATPNVDTWESRATAGYEEVEEVTYRELQAPDAPVGMVREFRFRLGEQVSYDTTLIFYFSHQTAQVYLDGEEVYMLQRAEELPILRTPGSNWAMIPLYREDAGKEVRVVLTPVYQNYQTQDIHFLIGSKLSICIAQLIACLPEMCLSVLDILTGLLLLGLAVYFSFKKEEGAGFYALALLGITLGLWNLSQSHAVSFLLREKTVFLYYLSLCMLMSCVIPLIRSAEALGRANGGRLLNRWCTICGGISVVQLALQLAGVLDLREMLKLTHGMIVVSSLLLIVNALAKGEKGESHGVSGLWLLGVGALIDMVFYYVRGTSSNLLFVLIAIFIYVLIEGFRMFSAYTRQKRMLEEKETQLTLSRTTTMMSQIRSHFVFNLLNAISGMCKYDPERADETVVRFARYLRNNIDIMEDDKPLLFTTELAHLEDYVVLEQVRFGDKIEFYTDVQADQFRIPPLILQPVVENAIKHGLTQKEDGGTVILRTWEEGESIKITVEDDGVGFQPSELEKRSSVGLKNIRYRLWHLMHGTLDIESQVGTGTTVTITLPKKEAGVCV